MPKLGSNRTVRNYLRRELFRDGQDRSRVEAAINFFRHVTYPEDYGIGLEIQKGWERGAHDETLFGRKKPGNQHFYEWLDWQMQDYTDTPDRVL